MFRSHAFRFVLILAVVLVLATATYTFAAANTLPTATYAGDGNVAISGITVTNIQYTITLTADPTTSYITGVTLTLASAVPATTTIEVKLLASSATWYTCIHTSTTIMTCDVSAANVTVTAADNLRVIAADLP